LLALSVGCVPLTVCLVCWSHLGLSGAVVFAGVTSNTAGNDEALVDLGEHSFETNTEKDAKIKEMTAKVKKKDVKNKELTERLSQAGLSDEGPTVVQGGGVGSTVVHELGSATEAGNGRRGGVAAAAKKATKKVVATMSKASNAKLEVDVAGQELVFKRLTTTKKSQWIAWFKGMPTEGVCMRALRNQRYRGGKLPTSIHWLKGLCKGGASRVMVRTAFRPLLQTKNRADAFELDPARTCSILKPNFLSGKLKSWLGKTAKMIKKLGLDPATEKKRLTTNPRMFVGLKVMCCIDGDRCVTRKMCTDLGSPACMSL